MYRGLQRPKIGRFGWEMTPNGEQFSTLSLLIFKVNFSLSDDELALVTVTTATKAIVH